MRCKFPNILGLMTAGVLLLGVPAWSGPALAQGAAMMGGVGDSEAVTVRAKVKAGEAIEHAKEAAKGVVDKAKDAAKPADAKP